jgi:hypothetical protein
MCVITPFVFDIYKRNKCRKKDPRSDELVTYMRAYHRMRTLCSDRISEKTRKYLHGRSDGTHLGEKKKTRRNMVSFP